AAACHAQMYIMGTLLRHGSGEQKRKYLPKIATGELRLQAFGVTEPNSGSDTTKLGTTAVRRDDRYIVNGRKMFISRVLQSDLMLLLARTTPVDQVKRRTDGLSVFLVDIRNLKGLEVRPLRMMMNHSTNALFFDDAEIPADSLIGEEGAGFAYILDGMNAERILVGSESIGDGRWFVEKAVAYSSQRVIFGRPIGANQGVQFPIAKAHTSVEAAALMRDKAAALFDAGQPCGPEANMAKYLAAEAAWEAANACIDRRGGRAPDRGHLVRPPQGGSPAARRRGGHGEDPPPSRDALRGAGAERQRRGACGGRGRGCDPHGRLGEREPQPRQREHDDRRVDPENRRGHARGRAGQGGRGLRHLDLVRLPLRGRRPPAAPRERRPPPRGHPPARGRSRGHDG